MLTAKLFPVQFRATEGCPQKSLGGRGITTELTTAIFQVGAIVDALAPLHGRRSGQFYDLPSRRIRGAALLNQEGMPTAGFPKYVIALSQEGRFHLRKA